MELNRLLEKVRALISKAEHPNTDPIEAQTYREKADALMLTHMIDDIMLDKTRPEEQRAKPAFIEIELGDTSADLTGWVASLAIQVATHCRCKVRNYTGVKRGQTWAECVYLSKVYGYESDLQYFQVLYTELRLHMLGALRPKPDPQKSYDDNCYVLHSAGYNWLDIARMYGWKGEADARTKFQAGGEVKRAYYRACKLRGEDPKIISAGGAEQYRQSTAQGYVTRMRSRFYETSQKREAGAALMLHGRMDDLEAFWRECNPDMFPKEPVEYAQCEACKKAKSGHCRAHLIGRMPRLKPVNREAYAAGVAHANAADLGGGSKVGGAKPELS